MMHLKMQHYEFSILIRLFFFAHVQIQSGGQEVA